MAMASELRGRMWARAASLEWTLTPIAVALMSRLFSFAAIASMEILGPFPFVPLASPANRLTAWDGQWYLSIAQNGYRAAAGLARLTDIGSPRRTHESDSDRTGRSRPCHCHRAQKLRSNRSCGNRGLWDRHCRMGGVQRRPDR